MAAQHLNQALQCYQQGNHCYALRLCEQYLKSSPKDSTALFLAGVVAQQLGKLEKAKKYLRRASKSNPYDPEIWVQLGALSQERGALEDAVDAFGRAANLVPKSPEIFNNLGGVLFELKNYEQAEKAFEAAISLQSDYDSPIVNLSLLLIETKQWERALPLLEQAIALEPDNSEHFINSSQALTQLDRPWESLKYLRRAILLSPNEIEWRIELGRQLFKLHQYREAEEVLRQALDREIGNPYCLVALGRLIGETGDIQEALALASAAAKSPNRSVDLRLDIGTLFAELGEFAKAEKCFRKILTYDPSHIAAYVSLTSVVSCNSDHSDISEMRRIVGDLAYEAPEKWRIHFALAQALHDVGEFDEAFSQYENGNQLFRASINFDIEDEERKLSEIASFFDAELVQDLSVRGFCSSIPIFIVGMPRSGTTLVDQIISNHPEVHGVGESTEFIRLINAFQRHLKYPSKAREWLRGEGNALLADVGRTYVERIRSASPIALRITDKNPFNHVNIGYILAALPQTRIVHCVRDPIDTCFSCFQQPFTDPIGYVWNLTELGRYHTAYDRLMAHWCEIGNDKLFKVSYENLVRDPEPEIWNLIEFCRLDWNESCLNFQKNPRSVRSASMAQVRKPLYNSSVNKWRHYTKHLRPLLNALEITPSSIK